VKVEVGKSNQVPSVAALLNDATARIESALGLERREARLEAQILASRALGVNRAWLVAHDRDVLGEAQAEAAEALIARRERGEPVAYILGEKEFYGRMFKLTPDVLIPRPETELLVEAALEHLPKDRPARVLDLGTGSGCVAISIALARPDCEVLAVDVSADALAVASDNARRLGARNVQCIHGNWYDANLGMKTFNMIVANPPYIPEGDPHLKTGDVRFEPLRALSPATDGLSAIRVIAKGAVNRLGTDAWLLFEHGYDQAHKCINLLSELGFVDVFSLPDLAGVMRVTGGSRR